jgi:Tol biopolymer transport system component
VTIAAATRLGAYEILGLLGAGGMGEVYRAKDPRLNREVAIKVLPEELFEGEERRQRFEREARLLAALNHPGIAAIYSFEEVPGSPSSSPSARHILVMELAEGEGLDRKIASSPLPLEESLSIARQIAEALEAAHEKGIVHRDLKPANVVVSNEGKVKLLDFGLAKAFENEHGSSPEISHSPTLTARATAAGVILGTAAYMSPEQARGRPVDKRADVWAFGVVLFEMLTGKRLFQGETVSDTLAAVLRDPVDFGKLPPSTPPSVRVLLERCLEREPKQRLQAIGESRIALERTIAGGSAIHVPAPRDAAPAAPPGRALLSLSWAVAAACAAAAIALALRARAPEARVYRASIPAPDGAVFSVDTTQPGPPVLSPDGRKLAFAARGADAKVRLFVRSLDSTAPQPLAGTEGAQYPFWSPDSRFVGFGADQKLKKIEASGGPPTVLCPTTDFPKGGSWSPKGVIVFAPSSGGPLWTVSENGGEARQVTKFDAKRGDNSHRLPYFLPDGSHFLFLARLGGAAPAEGNQVLVGSTDGGEPKPLLRSPAAAEYASGYLLFMRDTALLAQRFDASRLKLEGEPHPVAENVSIVRGAAKGTFSASQTGVLVAHVGDTIVLGADLEWVDRSGKTLASLSEHAPYDEAVISPDGRSVAVSLLDFKFGTHDVWICDVARNLRTRFTFEPGEELAPRWAPDGRSIAYVAGRGAQQGIFRKQVEGSAAEELLYASETVKIPTGFSPDGKLLAFAELGQDTNFDIWILPLAGDRKPYPFLKTSFSEAGAVFSPDGKWIAYHSNESGKSEVYVTPFPGPGRKWQVSAQGGGYPGWRQGGREIVYQEWQTNKVFSVPVSFRGDTPDFGRAAELFVAPPPLAGIAARFDAASDARKFMVVRQGKQREAQALTLVVNWTAELEGKR